MSINEQHDGNTDFRGCCHTVMHVAIKLNVFLWLQIPRVLLYFILTRKRSICWPKITLAVFADCGDAAWELNTQSNEMIINSSQQMDHCNELTRNLQRNTQSSCWDASLVYWDGRSHQSLQDHLKRATYLHSSVIGLVFKINYLIQQKNMQ